MFALVCAAQLASAQACGPLANSPDERNASTRSSPSHKGRRLRPIEADRGSGSRGWGRKSRAPPEPIAESAWPPLQAALGAQPSALNAQRDHANGLNLPPTQVKAAARVALIWATRSIGGVQALSSQGRSPKFTQRCRSAISRSTN